MKYKGSVEINKSRDIVVKYFQDPEYMGEYQDGFVSKKVIEGSQGQDGAVSEMVYKYGKHDMHMTETIKSNRLPDSFEAFYQHKDMDNTMLCTFTSLDENRTRYDYEFEYVRMEWFMPKLIAILFPSVYRKQGEKWMKQFKDFVENQND